MPRGVYVRTPAMKTYGKPHLRPIVLQLRGKGWSYGKISKKVKLSVPSVVRIVQGDWNSSRRKNVGIV
jgi:hypothetical protein